jgi:hypothetical protein
LQLLATERPTHRGRGEGPGLQAKKTIAELQDAKKNREAVSGIFVFWKDCEPVEFGNFKRIDSDYYRTVDRAL